MVTPAERPTGWVLVDATGVPVRAPNGPSTLYLGMRTAENAAARIGSHATPTPVWTREQWLRCMAALDSRVT